MTVLMDGIRFGESPRWHQGRLYLSDWGTGRVIALDPGTGHHQVVATVASFPMCIDFLPDGQLLIVDSARSRVLRANPGGVRTTHAELHTISTKPWNDLVVDEQGNAYVNNTGFAFPGEDFAPGLIVRVSPQGEVHPVADGLAFPNGMAITADGATLIVAESYANQLTAFDIGGDGELCNRRVWATTVDDHPDGICLDAEGAVWYADVANHHCVRIREGGQVLETVDIDRGAFACALSREDPPTLYVVGQEWGGSQDMGKIATGHIFGFPAPAAGAGRP